MKIKALSKTKKENLIKARSPGDSWWSTGIRFECQGSGQCCLSRKGYGYVYLTSKDISRLAKHFQLSPRNFKKLYCGTHDGEIYLLPPSIRTQSPLKASGCRYLSDKRCSVYKARPMQCRTWPFWPENMDAKIWTNEVMRDCPGVGKGRLFSAKTIRCILNRQQIG